MRPLWAIVGVFALLVVTSMGLSPVHVSYVTSDSMEPTLSPGDGYLVVESTTIESGDVITFDSSHTEGYVTHRVVRVTAEGYITKGDANPMTDQAAGVSPITDDAVIGKAVTVGGSMLVLPGVGSVLHTIADNSLLATILAAVVLALTAVSEYGGAAIQVPNRSVWTTGDVLLPLLVGLSIVAIVVLVFAVTSHSVVYVATVDGGSGATIPVGEQVERTVEVGITNLPGTTTLIEAEGVVIRESVERGSTVELAILVPPQADTGRVDGGIQVHTYPAVVPDAVLRSLHAIHPLVAKIVVTGAVFAPFWIVYLLAFDGRSPLRFRDIRVVNRGGK